jgi:H+/Cl- antiporter ClcA
MTIELDLYEIFNDIFLSQEMYGYLGVFLLIVGGYIIAQKSVFLGVIWFIVECLFVGQYLSLVDTTPAYWWHIFILLLGGLLTCVYPLWDRKRS